MSSNEGAVPFRGFRSPNYTQVPDELFDELLPVLSGAELKALLYIIRRTFGFKRDADAISLSQMLGGIVTRDGERLDGGVGLSKPTLLQALRTLEASNIIEKTRQRSAEKGDQPTIYRLKFASDDAHTPGSGTVVKKLDQGVVKNANSPVVKESASQETVKQQTEISLSNVRKATRSNDDYVDNTPSHPIMVGSSEPPITRHGMEDMATIMQRRLGRPKTSPQPAVSAGATAVAMHDPQLMPKRGRPRNDEYSEERQRILAYVKDFARELRDQAPLRSSVTRAYNLYQRSGVHISRFEDAMYQAKAKTQEYSATIRAQDDSGTFPVKAKMGYWFACLEDELGMKDDHANPSTPN
jgi:hypothetical protein